MGLRRARRSTTALALLLGSVCPSFAAQAPRPPRVVVVLSGGGPRALAHVGVLQALEDLHVPVDMVVGSQWGALVGGLYAAGYTPAEIEAALISSDWIDALDDHTPRRYLSFRSKQEDRDFLIDIPLGVGTRGLIFPPSLQGGSRMRLELARLTMRALGTESFDRLPIPFRAVATDLDYGGPVVLREGSLATAIEASLATPVLRQPVDWNGSRLVSGLMSDPIPVDVALATGADLILVVDVLDPGFDRAQLDFFGVGQRALQLVAREHEREALAQLRVSDLVCRPDLTEIDLADFESAHEVVERGRSAGRALADCLGTWVSDPEAWQERQRQRQERAQEYPVIDSVRAREGSPLGTESMSARMKNEVGQRFDPDVASADLARLYGLKLFRRVDFDLVPTSEDHADLVVGAEPVPTAPLHWRMGMSGELTAGDDVNFVVGASLRYAPTDDWGSEWRAHAELGNRVLALIERREALDASGRWYLVPRAAWREYPLQVETAGNPTAQFTVQEFDLGVDLVREIGDVWEARAGVVYSTGKSKLDIGDPTANGGDSFEEGGGLFGVTCDSLDDLAFPRSGWLSRAEWFLPVNAFKEGQDETVRFRVDHAFEAGRGALDVGGELSTVVGTANNVQSFFPLGGFLRLSGLPSDGISGPTAALARVVYTLPLTQRGLERKVFSWYAGTSLEAGNVYADFEDVDWQDLRIGGSLFLGVDTLIGPLYFGYGLTDGGDHSAFLVIGRQF